MPQFTMQEQYFDTGMGEPYTIKGVQLEQRKSLTEAIKEKSQERLGCL